MGKRVLVISNMYPSRKNPTYGIFVKNQVEALKEKGLDIEIAVNKDNRGGKVNVLKKYGIWLLKTLIKLRKGRSFDVVHAHYIFPSGLPALLFKKLFHTKLVVTSHGGDLDQMAKKNRWIRKMTEYILKESDHVIVVGEALKEEVTTNFGVNEEKVSLINMGVNRQVFAPIDTEEAKKELNLSLDSQHILFVGNLIEAKGLRELLSAFQQLRQENKEIELHILGSKKNINFLHELKASIVPENRELVHFHGTKDQKVVAQWMAAADLFVLPSHIEGFGLVALEAMSCHTPVVASDVGGLSYLLKNGAGELVPPKDALSLAEGIKRVLEGASLREGMVSTGERLAQENDDEVMLKRIINLYG
ncbi:Glycosyltransferase involved in cell wall bisynthesis [Halobacillus dabanensis]|uniref:Glycosyltransferase involved in cell wall bisynthesis n=1 Tax=Halobacillus dabanensis TaxID=240302 RepID=A0A1I3XFK6_HALDA|nr:glycosyltransferase [Halobacillus dabanensis]SFK18270.1 Glycosyltransferase involved in cell wall bisynthesis [Halobacillus dabanensis]